jgi:HAE1 family hydrophobic/amphiphilic exporter-1
VPGLVQSVLNFKDNENSIQFIPERDLIAKSNITVASIGFALRWLLFGPVVDKWLQNGEETDIRVAGRDLKNATLSRISNLYIPSSGGSIRLEDLGYLEKNASTGKIYHRDGRRAAYFTIHINSSGTNRAVKDIKTVLDTIEFEKGYGYVFSRDIEMLNSQYGILFISFIAIIIGILLLLTALSEKVINSFIVTSIIPVSCFFPLFIKFISGSPLEMGTIVGLVVVSGISVNNAIYICESHKSRINFRVREKMQSILATSLTSIVSAIPLAIAGGGDFSGALAQSVLWGTVGSLVSALILFPAVFSITQKKR